MSGPRPKVPRTPPAPLTRDDADVVAEQPVLWRIHRTQGDHVLEWHRLRTYGPLPLMRYEPQAPPPGEQVDGVMYAAADLATALAEVFQATRLIDPVSFAPSVTAWTPTRPLRLLDLTGTWALRNGAAHSLAHADRATCRAWARTIRTTWPDLDGLWAPSTMTSRPMVTLWNPAADSFPARPAFSRPLAEPTLQTVIRQLAAVELGYRVLD